MNRITVSIALVALILASASSPQEPGIPEARAQEKGVPEAKETTASKTRSNPAPPRSQFVMIRIWRLLQMPSVQKEIKLSADQKTRLKEIVERSDREDIEARKKEAEARKELGAEPDPQELASFRLMTGNASAGRSRNLDAAQLKVLNTAQRTRLEQIRLQVNGPMEFRNPAFQKRMNLSADQIDLLNATANGYVEERSRSAITDQAVTKFFVADPRNPGRRILLPDKSEALKAEYERLDKDLKTLRLSAERSILKILTKKQREKYRQMLGVPFDPWLPTWNPNTASASKDADADVK